MKITEHIHALKLPFSIRLSNECTVERFVYVFLLIGRKICLVDGGVAGSASAIFDSIRNLGRDPRDIALLILTHSHPDHVGGAKIIREQSGCFVAAHAAERNWIEDVERQGRERPVPGFASLVSGSVRVDRLLADNDILESDAHPRIEVLHTPGHSKGSISLWIPEDNALIAGDAIPRPGDIPIYEDVESTECSLRRLQALSNVKTLLSAWDVPRREEEVPRIFDEALGYVRQVHETVCRIGCQAEMPSPEECRRILDALGLGAVPANPLVARTFAAHWKMRGQTIQGTKETAEG